MKNLIGKYEQIITEKYGEDPTGGEALYDKVANFFYTKLCDADYTATDFILRDLAGVIENMASSHEEGRALLAYVFSYIKRTAKAENNTEVIQKIDDIISLRDAMPQNADVSVNES